MQPELRAYFFRHRHQAALLLSAFVLGLIAGGVLYWRAKYQALDQLQTLQRVKEEKQALLRKLAAAEVKVNVLQSGQLQLKKTLVDREATIAEQETSLEFYRNLMVIGDKAEGLDMSSYRIQRGDSADVYHFQFAFVQYAKEHSTLTGAVNIRLEGQEQGKVAVYYLRDLLTPSNAQFGNVSLKYYQMIEGDMILPKGFQPRILVVDVDIKQHNEIWQRKLDWQIEE
jgi:hypothetical protein